MHKAIFFSTILFWGSCAESEKPVPQGSSPRLSPETARKAESFQEDPVKMDSSYLSKTSPDELQQFSTCWFLMAIEYGPFQVRGTEFPLEYEIRDSNGVHKTLYFNTVEKMADWRRTEFPHMNNYFRTVFGNSTQVMWPGYAREVIDTNFILSPTYAVYPDTVATATYIYQNTIFDFHFKKTPTIWKIYKVSHWQFSWKEIQELEETDFESFYLRFLSDKAFCASRIKAKVREKIDQFGQPSETTVTPGADVASRYAREKVDFHLNSMILYTTFPKMQLAANSVQIHCNDEGGISCGTIFIKRSGKWMLEETWDASN